MTQIAVTIKFFDTFLENKIIFFQKFGHFFFLQCIRMDHSSHQNYKIENTEMKYLDNTKQGIVKNSPLELETDFTPVSVSIDDMVIFEEKEIMGKRTFAKTSWYDSFNWLINYIPESIRNSGWC